MRRLAPIALLVACLTSEPAAAGGAENSDRLFNLVIINCDDLGWGDLGSYGNREIRTPRLDRLACEGTRFTSFYSAQPVCSASRAALLTGCYSNRVGISGALPPNARRGIHEDETTLGELLKSRGHTTAIYGKWHLGDDLRFLPTRHGFDEYLGIPYSNDMWPHHPSRKDFPPLPLVEGESVIERMPDQRLLTGRYTDRALRFIERNRDRPFFLYLAHTMPHVPLHASDAFAGKSRRGLYGDVIEEIDDSTGRILDALEANGLDRRTWVIFTSDNGPWHTYGSHAGSAGPFREGKLSVFEAGVRVPCIMRWPGRIPAGRVCDEPLMTIDIFPTVAKAAGAALPSLPIDGKDVWPVLAGEPGARTPHPAYFFWYGDGELQALRSGRWKLHLPHKASGLRGRPGGEGGKPVASEEIAVGLELYDLEADPGESRDVAAANPEVVKGLLVHAEAARAELGDSLTERTGKGVREPGRLPEAAKKEE